MMDSEEDATRREVEVTLLAVAPSPTGGDDVEEILGVTDLERDPTKRERRCVRSSVGPQAGRRVRLRIPPSGGRVASVSIARRDVVALVRVGDLSLRAEIKPPLPTDHRADDPPIERQLGSLKADGVAVQLRFARRRRDDAAGETEAGDDGGARSMTTTTTTTTFEYEIIDGAFTADELTMEGIDALHAAGEVAATSARDAAALPQPTARTARSEEIWLPRKLKPDDEGYDERNPEKIAYDPRGKDRIEELLFETRQMAERHERDGRDWCGPLRAKINAKLKKLHALRARVGFIRELRKRLGNANEVVTEEMVRVLKATAIVQQVKHTVDGKVNSVEKEKQVTDGGEAFFDELGVDVDDLEGKTSSELLADLGVTQRACLRAQESANAMHDEITQRYELDRYESGVETRDVLENGVRRVDMEAILGRRAEKEDVDKTLEIPLVERMKLVGGYDVEQMKQDGTFVALPRLADVTGEEAWGLNIDVDE